MSQASENKPPKPPQRSVDDDMAYEAYKALIGVLGGPASRELGLSPEVTTALYLTKLIAANPAALAERFKTDEAMAEYGLTEEDLGQVAYEAYLHYVGGRSVSGQLLTGWHKLLPHISAAWTHAAHEVRGELVQEIRRRVDDLELRQRPEFIQGVADWQAGRVEDADVCSPASGYHSSPHRHCVLREADAASDDTPPGEWQ